MNKRFYDDSVMPNLNKLAQKGVVLPQTTSHGLPTIYGFLGLMTTEKPQIDGVNMVNGEFNNDEMFARQLKHKYGYYTSFTYSTPLEFDYTNTWVFAKHWFDEVHYFYPTEKQFKMLGLKPGANYTWLADRISSRIAALQITKLFTANRKVTINDAIDKFYNYFNQTPDKELLFEYLNDDVIKL